MRITQAAVKVEQLLLDEGAAEMALRVAVKSGGCSGFQYDMYFDGDIAADDIVITFGAVRVVVDPASAPLLEGASLDFKEDLTNKVLQSVIPAPHAVVVAANRLADSSCCEQHTAHFFFVENGVKSRLKNAF